MEFRFSDHTLDVERRELRRGADPIAVEPQVFDLLVYLLGNRDHVVSKDDLIAAVWLGRIVSESTLTSRINAARKAGVPLHETAFTLPWLGGSSLTNKKMLTKAEFRDLAKRVVGRAAA